MRRATITASRNSYGIGLRGKTGFSERKNYINKCLIITEADPRGISPLKFWSDHPTPLGSTCRTALYGVACQDCSVAEW